MYGILFKSAFVVVFFSNFVDRIHRNHLILKTTVYATSLFPPEAKLGSAKGGPYLGVHLRRKDFIWGHREDVPSLKGAVKNMRSLMKKNKLEKVFVATDADEEGNDIPTHLDTVCSLFDI